MDTSPLLRYVIAGKLERDFVLTPNGKPFLDVPGGSLFYAAGGLATWEQGCGLISRVGEDFPQEWLSIASRHAFDIRGIRILPESIDHRSFHAYPDLNTRQLDNPVSAFARLNLPFPRALLGYVAQGPMLDSRNQPTVLTLRLNDIPADYLDVTAAHLCPLDFLSHTLIPSALRQGNVTTITLDPSPGYMNPTYWDDIPVIVKGLTAFLCSEEKLRNLFAARSNDLWEMADTIAGYGCEIVVIKRGIAGQFLYDHTNHTKWHIPAYPIEVMDPTGAGDSFCGGFLAGYRETYDPLEAALRGNIASSFAIEANNPFYGMDAMPGLPDARLEAIRRLVRKM